MELLQATEIQIAGSWVQNHLEHKRIKQGLNLCIWLRLFRANFDEQMKYRQKISLANLLLGWGGIPPLRTRDL